MKIDISQSVETESNREVNFTARVDGKYVGNLSVIRAIERPFYRVNNSKVELAFRGQGIGKALYNAAAAHACRNRRKLVSDTQRSEWAEAFWRTQARRGRARCMELNKRNLPFDDYRLNYFPGPKDALFEHLYNECNKLHNFDHEKARRCADRALKLEMRGLPRPVRFTTIANYSALRWPCFRWATKKSSCNQTTAFEGFWKR